MRLIFITILLSVLLSVSCRKAENISARQAQSFIKFFGNSNVNLSSDVRQTADEGYIILGSSATNNQGDIYLVKTDKFGNQLWTKTFGGNYEDIGTCLQIDGDGNYILLAVVSDTSSFQRTGIQTDILLLKVDKAGNQIFEKRFVTQSNEIGYSFQITDDNGFAIIGSTTANDLNHNNNEGIQDILLLKTNNLGELQWQKTFGGKEDEYGTKVLQKPDKGFVIVGTTLSFSEVGQKNANVIVIETNKNGIEIDKMTYGGMDYDTGNDIIALSDGGYIITGSTSSSGSGMFDVFFIRIGAMIHNILWTKTFGGAKDDFAVASILTSSNEILTIGITESYGDASRNIYILKTDLNGNLKSSDFFGEDGIETGNALQETKDGGFIFTGCSDYKDNSMILLMKTNSDIKLDF